MDFSLYSINFQLKNALTQTNQANAEIFCKGVYDIETRV